jgi:sugar/nucleoside kinase (ribokinase family)
MTKPKVVVAGNICLDITPVFPAGNGTGVAIADVLRPGKLTRLDGVDIHAGGVVSNTGLAIALFGADVSLMGKVGKDAFGSMILELLRERGQGKGMIVADGARTSYSVVVAIPGSDRFFLHDPGANDTFRFSDLDFAAIRESALFHFGYPPIMRTMYENGGSELVRIFREVDEAGVMTSLDLAAVDGQSDAGKANWERILSEVLPHVDFFMPSLEELAFMIAPNALKALEARAGSGDIVDALSIEKDVEPLAERAIALGAKVVLVKCGAKGLYYRTAEKSHMRRLAEKFAMARDTSATAFLDDWSARSGFEASYVPEKILSGTGAGDTTIAAFLASMLEGYPFARCVQLAVGTGASCVEAYDALGGLRSFADLEAKIDAGWKKND